MFRFLRNDKYCMDDQSSFSVKLQPDLSGAPFYATKWSEKSGSGRRIKLPQLLFYGLVEKIEALAIIALRFIFRISLTHSAKSSG